VCGTRVGRERRQRVRVHCVWVWERRVRVRVRVRGCVRLCARGAEDGHGRVRLDVLGV
jgi:hypothetical protein